jgi:glycosyltransferase involved in cell wall biosynthesis
MKIAFIVPYVPNQIRTRSYNLISSLTSLGHQVDVFTVGSAQTDRLDAEALKAKCNSVYYQHLPLWQSLTNSVLALPSGQPLQTVYSWQPKLVAQLTALINGNVTGSAYDVIHVEHIRGSRYGVFLKSRFPAIPVVWDSVDCISYLFQQAANQSQSFFGKFITRFELPRTKKAEGNLICLFDHVLVTSPSDRNALLELNPAGKCSAEISVLPNGVDLGYFYPNAEFQRETETVVFSGKMSYHANISMAKYLAAEIMPRIWKRRPNTRLYIVGKDPSSDIKALGNNSLITVTGTVDDIRPFLWRATVAVVPLLYGAGIQNKILEAMATSTPVVTTFNALTALQVQVGKELFAVNDAEEFSQAVLRLLEDRSLQSKMGNVGSSYVENHHNWMAIASQLVEIYQDTLRPRAGSF